MTVAEVRHWLLWSTVVNYAVLFVWFGVFVYAHDWLYRTHSRWFQIPREPFDTIHYAGLAVYKIGILLLNLTPLIALSIRP